MVTLTEGTHAGGFIVSEANKTRSRETATVLSGEKLVAGQVVAADGNGKLIAMPGTLDTNGVLAESAVGILFDNVDASATGANADVENCVYVARDAEVNGDELTFPAETTDGGERAQVEAQLAALGIICR